MFKCGEGASESLTRMAREGLDLVLLVGLVFLVGDAARVGLGAVEAREDEVKDIAVPVDGPALDALLDVLRKVSTGVPGNAE